MFLIQNDKAILSDLTYQSIVLIVFTYTQTSLILRAAGVGKSIVINEFVKTTQSFYWQNSVLVVAPTSCDLQHQKMSLSKGNKLQTAYGKSESRDSTI